MGESITEGVILEWRKNVGDSIELDEILLEIGTDKVDSEIPSSSAGIIVEILAKPNETIEVGKVIAKIDVDGSSKGLKIDTIEKTKTQKQELKILQDSSYQNNPQNEPKLKESKKNKKFYTPVVMKIVEENSLSLNELESITGTGRGGRVTKKDIIAYLDNKKPIQDQVEKNNNIDFHPAVSNIRSANEEMSQMRKLISKHMMDSLATSAHVYVMVEVDMTRIVEYVDLYQNSFNQQEGFSLTYTPFIIQSTVRALKNFPIMNASLSDTTISYHKNINIGLAVAVNDGLMVPCLANCEEKNFLGICRSVNDLANRTREGRINADELSGSTFSITNFGVFGVSIGTPIINQPNVGILGVGAIKKQPVVVESSNGDAIAIRSIMILSLGFDHRLIDGAEGSKFITNIKNYLETMSLESIF